MKTSKWFMIAMLCAGAFTLAAQRFDLKVRNYFFAGFKGDLDALSHGMQMCEEAMRSDPDNAEALVWHGGGEYYLGGAAFQKGDTAKGAELSARGMEEMDRAAKMAPDNLGVRIPRGAVLLTASHYMPPEMARPLIEKGVSDYEHALELQSSNFETLGQHPRGELLFGLAEGYSRLGEEQKAQSFFERIERDLPETVYAKRAEDWMKTKSLPLAETGCVGCHVAK